MDVVSLVLAAFGASEGSIPSRTRTQKLTYFAAASLGLDFGFRQHYYGPYSSAVSAALDALVSVGAVAESNVRGSQDDRFPGDDEGSSSSTFSLTPAGLEFLRLARESGPDWFDGAVQSMKNLLSLGADDMTLACAAKLKNVAIQEGGAPDFESARRHCEELQWDLEPEAAEKALAIIG